LYDWQSLHHVYSLVRAIYSGAAIAEEAFGSLLVVQTQDDHRWDRFDYGDLFRQQVCCICVGDVGVIAVFNDSAGAISMFAPTVRKFDGPLSPVQLREVSVELGFLNEQIKERAEFMTLIDLEDKTSRIIATRPPDINLSKIDWELRGSMLLYAIRDLLPYLQVPGYSTEELERGILSGRFTFLFDENGKFVRHSIAPSGDAVGDSTKIEKPK
jgi:hypothetical protein